MSSTYTGGIALVMPSNGQTNWDVALNANATILDGLSPIGGLFVGTNENPSSTLKIRVTPGNYYAANGTIGTYAGTTGYLLTASTTTYLWLTDAGVLTSGTSFPTTAHVRLASVVAGASTITSISDQRVSQASAGSGLGFLLKTGDTFNDATAVVILTTGTTNGVEFGSSPSNKIGFHGTTPTAQRSGSAQAAITDSTTGTASATVNDGGSTYSQSTTNSNNATILALLNEIRATLVAKGLMKGSA